MKNTVTENVKLSLFLWDKTWSPNCSDSFSKFIGWFFEIISDAFFLLCVDSIFPYTPISFLIVLLLYSLYLHRWIVFVSFFFCYCVVIISFCKVALVLLLFLLYGGSCIVSFVFSEELRVEGEWDGRGVNRNIVVGCFCERKKSKFPKN